MPRGGGEHMDVPGTLTLPELFVSSVLQVSSHGVISIRKAEYFIIHLEGHSPHRHLKAFSISSRESYLKACIFQYLMPTRTKSIVRKDSIGPVSIVQFSCQCDGSNCQRFILTHSLEHTVHRVGSTSSCLWYVRSLVLSWSRQEVEREQETDQIYNPEIPLFEFGFYCCDKDITAKSNMGRKGLRQLNPSPSLRGTMQKPWRKAACWLVSHGLLFFSNIILFY